MVDIEGGKIEYIPARCCGIKWVAKYDKTADPLPFFDAVVTEANVIQFCTNLTAPPNGYQYPKDGGISIDQCRQNLEDCNIKLSP